MTANKKESDLQHGYKAMVEAIEEFVVKEGKSLQEAFHSAEEKLSEAKELSVEKIQQASKDLKYNLSVLGEAIEGASDAYKQQIAFDVAYINASIWNKLQSIANSNTVELMAFTKTLRENANAVETEEHLNAHQQHRQWGSEHALWLDEIAFWKRDHEQIVTKMIEIEKALKLQETLLNKHAHAIQAHVKKDHNHEKTMADVEQDHSSEKFKDADKRKNSSHKKEQGSHAQQSEVHRALKAKHIKVLAMVNMLYKETHQAT
ncbi:hypothetical protein [Glaciecola sp. SC05]|uniref:zinc ribbon-containing protein n=1 Tax=Glaciecola sp. SC05 TaxID=1987355 RepID=UPI003527359B